MDIAQRQHEEAAAVIDAHLADRGVHHARHGSSLREFAVVAYDLRRDEPADRTA
jgi:hypothetical protein